MNRLANEASPYLLQHKDNPVDWYPWGPEALAAAEAQNKPILLSIGYTACHWCHVMAQESFQDPETAAFMNANFINIKVDREERPDVDQVYQAAANLMGFAGGWPLTSFLTPKGVPFAVGTYFPKEERVGQAPAFMSSMSDVLQTFAERPESVQETTQNMMRELTALWHRDMRGPLDMGTLDSAAVRTAQRFDIFFGGIIGQTSKFPSVGLLDVTWRAFLRTGMTQFMQVTSTALDNMLLGGLWDHVGGGFVRHCQDERWLIPHWEKNLADNAMILELMLGVWQFNRNKLCDWRIAETVQFLLRDMRHGAAFASSIDSDVNGEFGTYYLWTEAEVDAALMGTFAAKFKAAYNISRDGNFEGKNILQRLGSQAPFPQADADEALLAKQRELLLKARQARPAPMRDDKILADWNGLVIAALANAGAATQNPAWIAAAVEAYDFIVKALGDGDRLYHAWYEGKRNVPGFADDYAQMIRAALTLYEVNGDKRYLDQAKRWTRTMNEHFWDSEKGGYYFTADDADHLIVRTRMLFDQPVPSSNGTMIQNLVKLLLATNEKEYGDRTNTIINVFGGEAQRSIVSTGTYFAGLEAALSAVHLVVIGPHNHPKTHELSLAILGRPLPNRLLSVISPEDSFPEGHPMHGKTMLNGQPTAYICQRGVPSAPITNPVTLSQALQLPPARPQPGSKPQ